MLMGFILWWYGAGWRQQIDAMQSRLLRVVDMFSIDLLLKTLFMPFRQISAGQVDGSLNVKLHAMIDKLVSRIIGAIVRLITIIAGILVLAGYLVVGIVLLLIWPMVPLMPIIGIILAGSGWLPWMA
ncbi:hypothetical protein TM7_0483 [candidate division TM7 genomosp. GTL1]|nr:hypothetical protein TM7_0483 [candidate division TM7 genomosp. GTL1]